MTLKSRSVFFTALISVSIQNYAQNMPILVELAKEQKWNELASLLEDGLNPNVIMVTARQHCIGRVIIIVKTRFKVYSQSMRTLTPPQIWA